MIRDVFWSIKLGKEIVLEEKAEENVKKQRKDLFAQEGIFFDTEDFHRYHCQFAHGVIRFHGIIEDSKLLGVIIPGEKEGVLKAPYAAPFSSLSLMEGFSGEEAVEMAEAFRDYAASCGKKVRLMLPPSCYDRRYAIKTAALLDAGFTIDYAHVSNYLDLEDLADVRDFIAKRPHSFRKNIKRGEAKNLQLEQGKDISMLRRAYQVIAKNRQERGFPLSMSCQQICHIATLEGSNVQGFVVTLDMVDIAGAIVFGVTPSCAQVIYWGNLMEAAGARPMEYLAVKLAAYYKELGFQILDIGPSTAEDRISYGLYRFKTTIGCRETLKFVFTYE